MSTGRLQPYIASFHQTRLRAAGDIFPYIIMLVGTFNDGFKYHVIGWGLVEGNVVLDSYKQAHTAATAMLNGEVISW